MAWRDGSRFHTVEDKALQIFEVVLASKLLLVTGRHAIKEGSNGACRGGDCALLPRVSASREGYCDVFLVVVYRFVGDMG